MGKLCRIGAAAALLASLAVAFLAGGVAQGNANAAAIPVSPVRASATVDGGPNGYFYRAYQPGAQAGGVQLETSYNGGASFQVGYFLGGNFPTNAPITMFRVEYTVYVHVRNGNTGYDYVKAFDTRRCPSGECVAYYPWTPVYNYVTNERP